MLVDLTLTALPDLPQARRLALVAGDLWRNQAVVALWLGGSLARQAGDAYSDVDLRVAVSGAAFTPDRLPDGAGRLADAAVAHLRFPFGDDATLHHMLLDDGEFYDVFVQTATRPPGAEARLVLACRDALFGAVLVGGQDPPVRFPPADGETIKQTVVSFWMSQQKHLRVLHRQIPLLNWEGEHRARQDLVRLWFALATGNDCGPVARLTIHTFSPLARVLADTRGPGGLAGLGLPLSTRQELLDATAWSQNEVARAGRLLAERLGFEYPAALEQTVRQSWAPFRVNLPAAHQD